MFPDDSVQSIITPSLWWEETETKNLERGCLVYAFIPHVDQVPYTIKPVGRSQAERHDSAKLDIAPLRMKDRRKKEDLPVAAMTLHDSELWAAYRAKKRVCLVLGSAVPAVDNKLRFGMPKKSTAPTVIVAPYYGSDQDGTRAGYNPELVERIRHAEYPQFFWDKLPISGPKESILRLDHIQPVGTQSNSYELAKYKLSENAMELMDDLLKWLIWGGVPADSLILDYRKEIESTFG
ncbi:MAG: hypothetical protein RAP70_07350 [Candidatus Celaenobacter antarcticus]|nr:hypothetical protein [Candidatus Celaenobacter antarcticus]